MKRIVFHVGPEKTGSTLIQNYFSLNPGIITDNTGGHVVFYGPETVLDSGLLSQTQQIVKTGEGDITALESLLEMAPNAPTVIISHESLFGNPDTCGFYGSRGGRRKVVDAMIRSSREINTEFVFYYKEPYKLIESYYRHYVMHGGELDVIDYLKLVPLVEMSFVAFRKDLLDLAGADNVKMLSAQIDTPDAFFRRFCAALKLTVEERSVIVPGDTNRSWSSSKTEVARLANSKLSPSERDSWIRAMWNLPLGDENDAAVVPKPITDLMRQLYADEHRLLSAEFTDQDNASLCKLSA